MSPTGGVWPGVAPQANRSETKSSQPPPRGVGQNSWSALLIAEPRFVMGPQGEFLFARSATQMSFLPNPPARVEAMYSCLPFGDSIGQPSCAAVFAAVTALGAPHSEYAGDAPAATGRIAALMRRNAPRVDAVARHPLRCGSLAIAAARTLICFSICCRRGVPLALEAEGGVSLCLPHRQAP